MKIIGCSFMVLVLYLIALSNPLLAKSPKASLTKEWLRQAIDEAKKGDRTKLDQIVEAGDTVFPKESLSELISSLRDEDAQIQLVGAMGLNALKSPRSKDALVEYLKVKDFAKLEKSLDREQLDRKQYIWQIQASVYAILALGEIGDKSIIPFLESLREVKELTRFEGLGGPVEQALAKLGAEGVKSLSRLGPKASDSELSRTAQAISQIRDPKQIPALIATVKDGQTPEYVRGAALNAIGEMQKTNALPYLIAVVRDTNYSAYVRNSAVWVASKMRSSEVEAIILDFMADPQCHMSECLYSLVVISPERHLQRALDFVMDKSAPIRERERLSSLFDLRNFGANHVKQNRELFAQCLKAVKEDGSPADEIRVEIWILLNKATGEEPQVELSRSKSAAAYSLQSSIREQVEHANYRLLNRAPDEEVRRLANEKFGKIVRFATDEKIGAQ